MQPRQLWKLHRLRIETEASRRTREKLAAPIAAGADEIAASSERFESVDLTIRPRPCRATAPPAEPVTLS
jgi:hypothetical protein